MDGGTTVRHGRRRSPDGGASLVEFAFIMPVLFTLLIGIFTGGLTLSRQNSVENAVREGTRFGAVNPVDEANRFTYVGQVVDQAKAAATGDLDDGVADKTICAAYTDGTTFWKITEDSTGTRSQASGVGESFECIAGGDGRPSAEERVQVSASRTSEIEGVFFSLNPTLSSQSVTRYER